MEKLDMIFSAKDMGERIAARRKDLGLTQEQAAEMAGLSHQFFSNVETGYKNIRAENLMKVSHTLRISTDYLLTGKSTDVDMESITAMLRELDERQLRCAEEIMKNLLVACGKG